MAKDPKKFDNLELTAEEQDYYRTMWGFDLVAEKIEPTSIMNEERKENNLPPLLYYYDAPISIENDPELETAGVKVHTRVEVDEHGADNRIIFRRGDECSTVYCVHSAVYTAPAEKMMVLPEDKLPVIANSTEYAPAILPPWGHFVALKSYVAGIASVGFLELYRRSYQQNELKEASDGHFLNMTLSSQINKALHSIAPEVVQPILFEILGDLLERVPVKWLIDRWEFFAVSGGDEAIINKDFLESLDFSSRKKLLDLFLSLWEATGAEGFWEFEDKVLCALLSGEFAKNLDNQTIHRVFEPIFRIHNPLREQPELGKIAYDLFMQEIYREDLEVLKVHFLHKLEFALEDLNFRYRPIDVRNDVSPEYWRAISGAPVLIAKFIAIRWD